MSAEIHYLLQQRLPNIFVLLNSNQRQLLSLQTHESYEISDAEVKGQNEMESPVKYI